MTGTVVQLQRLIGAGAAARRERRRDGLALAALIIGVGALAAALFWRCLGYFFVTDDFALIEAGRAPLRVGIPAHFLPQPGQQYRPLAQYGYFWLAGRFFGLRPRDWHEANLALYLCALALAAVVFRQLLGSWAGRAVALGFFGLHSALFLVIAWVALAGEIWPVLFSLLALALYLRFLRARRSWWLVGAAVTCLAALLAKEVAVSLPPLIVLAQLLFAPSRRRVRGRRLWLDWSVLPFVALEAGYLLLVTRVQGVPQSGPYHPELRLGAIWTFLGYCWLSVDLPQRFNPGHGILALLGLACTLLVVWTACRPDRVALFGLVWFVLGIAPVVFLPEHMFRYYLYWPLGGLALVLGRVVERLTAALRRPLRRALLPAGLALAILAGDAAGVAAQRRTDPTMAQAAAGQRVLAVIARDHPTFPDGATITFAAPAHAVYYLLGYGAALRLYHPGDNLHVYFAGELPPPDHPSQPVFVYCWTGETVVADPGK